MLHSIWQCAQKYQPSVSKRRPVILVNCWCNAQCLFMNVTLIRRRHKPFSSDQDHLTALSFADIFLEKVANLTTFKAIQTYLPCQRHLPTFAVAIPPACAPRLPLDVHCRFRRSRIYQLGPSHPLKVMRERSQRVSQTSMRSCPLLDLLNQASSTRTVSISQWL
jgi:hypothetical protein